ncbi:MAG: thioredoxin-disulfide reductase [bacterium]
MYDTIIIGAGVAGMTAAIYTQRRAMKTLIISKDIGGQVNLTFDIENYPGFETISSFELIERMSNQVKKLGVEIKTAEVTEIKKLGDKEFVVKTSSEEFKSKTLILVLGLLPRRLNIPGEQEFAGKGVSYCATCDGPFFKNKKVAVVGGGNSALDAAEYLSKIASDVYLIHRREEFRGFEEVIKEVKERPNVRIILNSKVKEIIGKKKVEKIKIASKDEEEIEVDGIFIEAGRIANTDLVADLVDRDERNQIIINEDCATSNPGIFAAGDVTQTKFKQITIACGLGTIAALSAYEYLHKGHEATDYGKK